MKNKICKKKTNKATKKDIKNHINQNNSNNNMTCISFKFVSFMLIMNQLI